MTNGTLSFRLRKRCPGRAKARGFTLVEVVIASSILLIAVSMAMMGLGYVIKHARQANVQGELDMEVQCAMEELKRDLRLSAMEKLFLYPPSGAYKGLLFPMCRDDDGDGAVEVDGDSKIIWDKTMVYHRWEGTPNELRLTVFDPRDNTLTDAERLEQLEAVVNDGHGSNTHNGAHCTTKTLFKNLFDWDVVPASSSYDAYAPYLTRETDVVLGSCVMSGGSHTLRFEVVDKNNSSSGYKIGIDSIFMSPSYSVREGEAQLPVTAQSPAGIAAAQYMAGGSWSGNYQLHFPATATGRYFTVTLENDRWENTNFRKTGYRENQTVVEFDRTSTPYDYVVMLDGNDTNWFAWRYTGDYAGSGLPTDSFRSSAVRVLMRGSDMTEGGYIGSCGARCKVNFRAGPNASDKLKITAAYIAECVSSNTPSPDLVAATAVPITFGGAASTTIDGGSDRWSDELNFDIDQDKSYIVSYLVDNAEAMGNPWRWTDYAVPGRIGSYVITNAGTGEFASWQWSTNSHMSSHAAVYGVQYLFTSYPTNGTYVSGIFDTHLVNPNYTSLDWSSDVPGGCGLWLKVRSAVSSDMSDAKEWDEFGELLMPGAIDPINQSGIEARYVQFMAGFQPDATCSQTPKLKSVTVKWDGEPQVVDVGGTFTKGPDYGKFKMLVDGMNLQSGIKIDLEIYDYVPGFGGATSTVTSAISTELMPRNTGK